MLRGKLTIGRYMSTDKDHQCYIEIEDVSSGVMFIHLELSAEQLGLALTGLSARPCEFDVNATVVGKKRESKSEYIEVAIDRSRDEIVDILYDEARQYEVDGWKCSLNKTARFNWDRNGNWAKIEVPFVRYVDAE